MGKSGKRGKAKPQHRKGHQSGLEEFLDYLSEEEVAYHDDTISDEISSQDYFSEDTEDVIILDPNGDMWVKIWILGQDDDAEVRVSKNCMWRASKH